MELSVIENDPKEVKKYLQNFVPINYYRVLDDAYLHQIRAVLLHSVSHAELYNPVYAGLINDLTVTSGKNYAIVNTKIEGLVDNFSALATKTEILEVGAANANASIIEIQEATAEQNKAQASFNQRLEASLDDIVVGGRNIMKNSDFSKGYRAWQEASITQHNHFIGIMHKISSTGIVGSLMGIYPLAEYQNMAMVEGTEYSISFYAYGSILLMDEIYLTSPSEAPIKLPSVVISTDLSERRHITFKAPTGGGGLGLIFGATATSEEDWFSISRIKVELGNRPSDWTPAPEDVEGYINEVQSSIDSFKDVQVERNLATAQTIDKIDTRIKDNAASILEEKNTRVDQFSALSQVNTELLSKTNENEAAIKTVDLTFTDRYNANVSRLGVLEADNSLGKGKIENLESITSSLGEVVVTQENTLNAKIDNLTMGGRNLLRNSDFKLGVDTWGTSEISNDDSIVGNLTTVTNTGTSADYFGLTPVNIFKTVTLIKHKEYVLSFYAKGNIPSINDIWITAEGDLPQQIDSVEITEGISDRYSIVFTANHTTEEGSIIIGASGYDEDAWFAVAAVKLEIGNKASDWTEAPEDTNAFIHNVEANINEFKEVQVKYNEAKALQLSELTTKTDDNIAELSELREITSNVEGSTAALETKLRSEYVSAISTTKSDITKATDGKIDAVKETLSEMSTDISSKADITRVDSIENDAKQSLAAAKTEITSSYTSALTTAKSEIAADVTNKANEAKADAITYTDGKVSTLATLVDSKADISRVDEVENNANQSLASAKSTITSEYTSAISTAKEESSDDAQIRADKALADANSNADIKAGEAQEAAEEYALAKAKAEADAALALAKGDATSKADAAESAAIAEAALDAKNKADKALADAKIDATAKAEAAKVYAKDLVDTLSTVVNSKADISRVDEVVNDSTKALAQAKTDITGAYNLAITESSKLSATDAQNKADKALADATIKATEAQTAAETYALAQAEAEAAAALDSAKSDATSKANKAKADAELAAALDAKNKADEALRLAKLDATDKADAVKELVESLSKVVDSKASISRVDTIENTAKQALATAKTELTTDFTSSISEAINEIEIGGRNYFPSLYLSDMSNWEGGSYKYPKNPIKLEPNETYTLHIKKVDLTTGWGVLHLFTGERDAKVSLISSVYNNSNNPRIYENVTRTFTVDDTGNLWLSVYGHNITTYWTEAQIFKGTVLQDWSPSPEDTIGYIDGEISSVITQVESKADISRVDTVESNAEEALASAKTELTGEYSSAITTAKNESAADAQTKADAASKSAKDYTDQQIVVVNEEIDSKADITRVDSLENSTTESIASAKTELISSFSQSIAESVTNSEGYSRLQAEEALRLAKLDATAKADDAITAAIDLAALDAADKANQAKKDAEAAAKTFTTTEVTKANSRIDTLSTSINDAKQSLVEQGNLITSNFNSTTTLVESTKKDLDEKIDGIEIGGRNYAINSQPISSGSTRLRRAISNDILKLAGQEITISADVRSDVTTSGSVYIVQLPTSYVARGNSFKNITSEWKRHSVVLPVNVNIADLTSLSVTLAVNGSDVEVKNWKVEQGNKATDWTPAPEDTTDYVDKGLADAKITSEQYAAQKANEALAAANDNTATKADEAQDAAEKYALAKAKAEADAALVLAKSDATTKANAAKSEAEAAAALDAKKKADKALADAKLDATAKADAAKIYADGIVKTLKTEVDSKATITQLNTVKNDANQALATAKTELTGSYTKAIENIEVGGRNLFQQSNYSHHANGSTYNSSTVSSAVIKIEPNTTYTINYTVTDSNRFGIFQGDLPDTNFKSPLQNVKTIRNFISVVIGTKINETFTTGEEGNYIIIYISNVKNNAREPYLKIEKGNKATDWTPAPEDVTDYVDTSVSTLKTLVDSKASIDRVDTVENNASKALATAKTELTGSYNSAITKAKGESATDAQTRANQALKDAKTDATGKANEAERLAKAYADTQVTALTKVVDSKANISRVDAIENNAKQALATAKTELTSSFNTTVEGIEAKINWQVLTTSQDLNNMLTQGSYFIKATKNTNAPFTNWTYIVVDAAITERLTQTVWADNNPALRYMRVKTDTTWKDWEKMATGAEIDAASTQSQANIESLAKTVANNKTASALTSQTLEARINVSNGTNLISFVSLLGGYYGADGSITAGSIDRYDPNYYPCSGGDKYTFTLFAHYGRVGGTGRILFYNSSKNIISSVDTHKRDVFKSVTVTAPSNAAFFRHSLIGENIKAKLEKGSKATPWTPSELDNYTGSENLFSIADCISGYESGGEIKVSTPRHQTMQTLVPISGDRDLVMQIWNPNEVAATSGSNRIAYFTSTKTYISSTYLIKPEGEAYKSQILTPPSNARFVRIGFIVGIDGIDSSIRFKVEEGEATPWSPSPREHMAASAAIEETKEVVAGVSARWSLRLSANGYISGMEQYNTGLRSGFVVIADEFKIVNSTGWGQYPFRTDGNYVYIQNGMIENGSITNAKIANLAVDTAKIANLAVGTAKIANGAIKTAKIDNLAVKSAQIDNLAVTRGKIANLAVDTLQIANNAVTVPRHVYNANTVSGIQGGNVTKELCRATIDVKGGAASITVSVDTARAKASGVSSGSRARVSIDVSVLNSNEILKTYVVADSTGADVENKYITLPPILDRNRNGNVTYVVRMHAYAFTNSGNITSVTGTTLQILGVKK